MNMNIQDHIFGEVCVLVLNDCAHCNHKALNAFIHWESKDQGGLPGFQFGRMELPNFQNFATIPLNKFSKICTTTK